MNVTLFTIAFLLMMGSIVYLLSSNVKRLQVVKAGKVTKFCKRTQLVFGRIPTSIVVNGRKVDIRDKEVLLVQGNSMKDYQIRDGQKVIVSRMDDPSKMHITTFPVLVFRIVDKENKEDADFKLRKFVSYVHDDQWNKLYHSLRDRMRIEERMFISQCSTKYAKLTDADKSSLVLSETFDEDRNVVAYSLHLVSSIYGKVEYAIGS